MMQRTPTIADSLKGFHTVLRYVDRDMNTSGERSVPWGRGPRPVPVLTHETDPEVAA